MFLGLKKLLSEERESFMTKLALGTGVTTGGIAVYEVCEFVKQNPKEMLDIVRSFGADFVLAVILIMLVNRLIGVMEKNASSTQEMADAMHAISTKDDRQAERFELMTQYSAQTSSDVAEAMKGFAAAQQLQNSALDRIERRQSEMKSQIDSLTPAVPPARPALVEKG